VLLRPCAAAAGVGLYVDTTAYVFYMHTMFKLAAFCLRAVSMSTSMSVRNVRWPRRMLPPVSYGEYAEGTDRRPGRTDARPLRYAYR